MSRFAITEHSRDWLLAEDRQGLSNSGPDTCPLHFIRQETKSLSRLVLKLAVFAANNM